MAEPPPPQYARRETPSPLGDAGTPYHVREKTGKARDSARFGALIAGAMILFLLPVVSDSLPNRHQKKIFFCRYSTLRTGRVMYM